MRNIIITVLVLIILVSCSSSEKKVETNWISKDADRRMEQGIDAFNNRSFDKAEKDFFLALRSYILVDDQYGQASAYLNLGSLYMVRQQPDQALPVFQNAFDIATRINDQALRIDAVSSLAGLHIFTGDLVKAEELISQGLESAGKTALPGREATLLNHLGTLNLKKGDYQSAKKNLNDALKLNQGIANKAGESANYFNLGLVSMALRDYETAAAYFNQSLSINKELEKPDYIAKDLEKLGDVSLQNNRRKDALSYYTRASLIHQQLKNEKDLERLTKKIQVGDQ
ncbi:MAG: tetratricopeptide repeat protein [Deltaproteobacteria bacterium]|nr:tetratricopeptide repeat protein [Deltaproteobacteria bacterium]